MFIDEINNSDNSLLGICVHSFLFHLKEGQKVVDQMEFLKTDPLLKKEGNKDQINKVIKTFVLDQAYVWIEEIYGRLNDIKNLFPTSFFEDIGQIYVNILTHYDVMDTEVEVKWRNRDGVLHAGSVDLVLRERNTGALGVVEINTSFRGELEKSRFYRYNMETLRQGEDSLLDELNMQTLAYQTMINETWRKHNPDDPDRKIIQWRGWLPLDIVGRMEDHNIIMIKFPQRVIPAALKNNERLEMGGVYLLTDRPEHLKRVAETFSNQGS